MRRKYTIEKDPETGRKVYKTEDVPDTPEVTVAEKLTDLLEKLTDKVKLLAENVWEAIGDLRKNVGDVRLDVNRLGAEVTTLKADRDRAWSLAESRNAVHHKAAKDLTEALQRFNERLSKLEGKAGTEVLNGSVQMLTECLVSHNERISKLEESRKINGVMPLFKGPEADLIRALPNILRLIHSPDFVKAVETAGYKIDVDSIIELVQKVVDERQAAQEQAKPAKVDLSYSQLPRKS